MTALLHDLLADTTTHSPKQIAVQTESGSLTYAQLNRMANQLAEKLALCRLPKGGRVGLLVHKSLEAYVAIYGILKAGCAYVPLDRRAPVERLAYIMDDCQISALVTTAQAARQLDDIIDASHNIEIVVQLDGSPDGDCGKATIFGPDDVFGLEPKTNVHVVDTDLAYILYTSGSTGRPKGVMISHAVSISFVEWAAECARLSKVDRVSGHAPLHFDLSIFDIFATAKAGATLFPVADGASTFPAALTDWIIHNRISVWYSVPSILSMMAKQRNFESRQFDSLRLVVFAGEVFPVKYLKIWLEVASNTAFLNWYGPTETNVVTSYTVDDSPAELDAPVPIGKPTSNADLFCVSDQGETIKTTGEVGELFARGPCVALGYWGDEEKTNQRFLPNSAQSWLRDRVYKTGDLVYLDDDGNYVYKGRIDHQIKCRGYRIEIGEIESALYRLSCVHEAAVVPVPDEVIGNRLIAFLALGNNDRKTPDEIITQVGEFLPRYMLPEAILIEERLPKTSNGKIDRQKLLQQAQSNSAG